MTNLTVGVLALQGAFAEHIKLLRQAADELRLQSNDTLQHNTHPHASPHTDGVLKDADADADILIHKPYSTSTDFFNHSFDCIEVRNASELARCDALILPGGESTSISLIAERCGLLEPLRDFVKVARKPVWGTCAGLILLAESANKSKSSGQELIGGLDVRVQRNYFGRQVESFEADLDLPFLESGPFHSVFIRAPVVEKVLTPTSSVPSASSDDTVLAPPRQATKAQVEILGRLPGRAKTIKDKTVNAEDLGEDGDIVAVRQGNVFGIAFHPELTGDSRIHGWWLREVLKAKTAQRGIGDTDSPKELVTGS
ncbi:Senecionine N-oxygenase [Elasticomyces elasticus]|nr:Senecionine N-oxygenase [Elasticomyces elasticus]